MTEQSTLLTLLLIRLNTDCLWMPVIGKLRMWTNVDAKTAHLCNDISA